MLGKMDSTQKPSQSLANYDPQDLPDYLNVYYKRLFPFGLFYRWLSYGDVEKGYFYRREFSFALKDDIYVRYQSFRDRAEMEREIQKKCPHKIDIGAVFSHTPRDHKSINPAAFQAQEKELVFDIDMTDYDEVRTCCSGAAICEKCWPFMTVAIKIIDKALRNDFGFEHLLWVYSGRRGVHCWVADECARKLTQSGRSSIAEYLSIVKGGENQVKKVHLYGSGPLHPSLKRAYDVIEKHFVSLALKDQDILGDEANWTKVLALIPEASVRDSFTAEWKSDHETSAQRWSNLLNQLEIKTKTGKGGVQLSQCSKEIMFQYVYPRLDVNVSKGVNHLLKSPFCVHPKTGRVCVPIDLDRLEEFDPFKVPLVSEICAELEKTRADVGDGKTSKSEWRGTCLKKYVDVFEKFLQPMERIWLQKRKKMSDSSMQW
eukprot:m.311235 g.311235  ORF g.311235 m.311235 type:complete len:430 (+) comp62960_c0_seq1:28-1317(+)